MPRFTKSDHEALVEIFKKIGQKDLTKVGLQELYNFKVENPHVDLELFLVSQWIRKMLRIIPSLAPHKQAVATLVALVSCNMWWSQDFTKIFSCTGYRSVRAQSSVSNQR